MVDQGLGTTNLLLGILAAVSVVEAVTLTVLLIVGARFVRRTNGLVHDLRQQVTALSTRLQTVAALIESSAHDVQRVTSRAAASAERAQVVFDTAMELLPLAVASGPTSLARRGARLIHVMRGFGGAYRVLKVLRRRRPPRSAGASARGLEEHRGREVASTLHARSG